MTTRFTVSHRWLTQRWYSFRYNGVQIIKESVTPSSMSRKSAWDLERLKLESTRTGYATNTAKACEDRLCYVGVAGHGGGMHAMFGEDEGRACRLVEDTGDSGQKKPAELVVQKQCFAFDNLDQCLRHELWISADVPWPVCPRISTQGASRRAGAAHQPGWWWWSTEFQGSFWEVSDTFSSRFSFATANCVYFLIPLGIPPISSINMI